MNGNRISDTEDAQVWLMTRDEARYRKSRMALIMFKNHFTPRSEKVVIKKAPPAANQAAYNEARIQNLMSRCGTPCPIARLLWAGIDHLGFFYVAMEHVAGETLHKYIQRTGDVTTYMPAILQALATLAQCGLGRHGDLHPANIVITPDNQVRIIDFGLARLGPDETHLNAAYLRAQANNKVTKAKHALGKRRRPWNNDGSPRGSNGAGPSRGFLSFDM